jgi:hypothetical protein
VIACKVSQYSKNDRDAEDYAAFKSVIRTLMKKDANVVEELTRLLKPLFHCQTHLDFICRRSTEQAKPLNNYDQQKGVKEW